jgi:hypothetical protein
VPFQEELSGAVNDLASRVVCIPAQPVPTDEDKQHDHGKHKGQPKKNHEGND